MIKVSIVTPVYSGEAYLRRLVGEVERLRDECVAKQAPFAAHELILVDDEAVDGSGVLIDELGREKSWVNPIHLSRNFGQHAATIAGILHSSGDWVATIDEDLQHPPGRIVELLRRAVTEQRDVIYASPSEGIHETMMRDWTSRTYKRLIEMLSGNPNVRKVNSFRLIRGAVARAASSVCAHDTFFDVALSWFTKRIDVVTMTLKDERYISTGRSGYRFRSLLSHARKLLFSSHIKILRAASLSGLVISGIVLVLSLVLLFSKVLFPTAIESVGWTSLMLTIAFFGGVIVFLLGIVLEYLSFLILRAHGKPLYFTIDRSSDAVLHAYFARWT
ncbi:glycosyltransferase [Aquibium sp. LZ166]|uniref:Glycosyltransferase n=1 Tax=Aquibium pacificus TaxID=3153579 RepID=A0ABV3SU81_9HYPH